MQHLQGTFRIRLCMKKSDTRLHGLGKAILRLSQSCIQRPLSGRFPGRPGDLYKADDISQLGVSRFKWQLTQRTIREIEKIPSIALVRCHRTSPTDHHQCRFTREIPGIGCGHEVRELSLCTMCLLQVSPLFSPSHVPYFGKKNHTL